MGDELQPWHQNWLVNIEYDRVDLVKEGANSKAHIKLFKSRGGTEMTLEEILKKLTPEHAAVVQKALDDAKAAVQKAKDDAEEAIKKAKDEGQAPAVGTSEEEILKTVKDPAVKALLETSIAKTKAAEAVAKQLKEEQDTKEAIAKAKELPNIGAEENKLAEVYKKLKGVDATLCEDVFGIFKAASALAGKGGAFQEIGKSSTDNGVLLQNEEAAWAEIDKAAGEIAKRDNVAKSAAISKAIAENPELYAQYLKAQRG